MQYLSYTPLSLAEAQPEMTNNRDFNNNRWQSHGISCLGEVFWYVLNSCVHQKHPTAVPHVVIIFIMIQSTESIQALCNLLSTWNHILRPFAGQRFYAQLPLTRRGWTWGGVMETVAGNRLYSLAHDHGLPHCSGHLCVRLR